VRRPAVLVLAIAVLAVACAKYPQVIGPLARTDLYVLLPGAGGASSGALAVTSGAQQHTLATPYAAATVAQPGTIGTKTMTEAETRSMFEAALAAQPPRPTAYVLYFLLDSDELTPASRAVVETILGEIANRPAPEVIVIGHTDTMGSQEYNDDLSLKRAKLVRAKLIERGLKEADVEASGRGERELLVPTADQVAEARNRRVEIIVK
jgi:outer membrane protein OmpA-like peptidoglycan-associated protein